MSNHITQRIAANAGNPHLVNPEVMGFAKSTVFCPVCITPRGTHEKAADCCLHLHPTMTSAGAAKVAQAVRAGDSWLDAIERFKDQ